MLIKKLNKKALICLILGFILVFSLSRSSANIVTSIWEESFENLNEWDLIGYTAEQSIGSDPFLPTGHGISITDGKLRCSLPSTSWKNVSMAIHDSTVAYGNWSFDWEVNSAAYVAIWFGATDLDMNWNWIGVSNPDLNMTGYLIAILSTDFADINSGDFGWEGPGIAIFESDPSILPNKARRMDEYKLSEDLVGSHHLDITHNLEGEFNVSIDGEQVLYTIDNTTSTSEKFALEWLRGDSSFDNISVSVYDDSSDTSTTNNTSFIELELLIPTIGLSMIVLYNTKRRKK